MPKLGAYSKEIMLARPDRRTREGRLLKQMRLALTESLGGEAGLTPAQRALVERAAWLQLRCAALDRKMLEGTFTQMDTNVYLAWCNTLGRTLSRLNLVAPEPAVNPGDDPFAELRAHVQRSEDAAA